MSRAAKPDRVKWLNFSVIGLFLLAAFSQAKVQIFDRAHTLARARETQRFDMSRTEYARRGAILSADGKALAQDQDAYELGITFVKVPQSDAFFMDLSSATGIPATEFSELAASGVKSGSWKQEMSPLQAKAVGQVKNDWRADGLSLSRRAKRSYALGYAAAGVIGAIRDGKPVSGLEAAENRVLAGRDGKTIGLLDRTGAFLPMRIEAGSTEKMDGLPVLTTIDSGLQELASEVIKDSVTKYNADSGVIIVMDPKTGDVLAMSNYPTYNPGIAANIATADERTSDINSTIQERFEPGSMFKILTLAKAFDAGKTSATDTVYCSGQMSVAGSKPFHCDKHEVHGRVTPEMAIAESCNIAAANWSLRVGYDGMVSYIKDLGLLKPTRVGLPGEVHGQFRENEPAKQLQIAHVGFGQSITATPIGLCSAFTMVANGGIRMQPRLVQKIGSTPNPVKSLGRVVKPESAEFVRHCMEAVIQSDSGTGKTLQIPGYRLAGKTGTAQKIGPGQTGHVANFVGFVPAVNPKAVVLVMIDNPKGAVFYGAPVAGPCFQKVAKGVIRRFNIPPTEGLGNTVVSKVASAPLIRKAKVSAPR